LSGTFTNNGTISPATSTTAFSTGRVIGGPM
jgi:hypothetical protein